MLPNTETKSDEASPGTTVTKRAKRKAAPKRRIKVAATKRTRGSKTRGPGKRYTKAEKARILAVARKGNLTGAQVQKNFGISMLTFYRWRGPVRGKRTGQRGPGRPKGSGRVRVDESAVRRAVQEQIRKILPRIIREEVASALRIR